MRVHSHAMCARESVLRSEYAEVGAKKWEYLVSRRSIPSQNLYRDEKTISFRFTIANIGGMKFSSKQIGEKNHF